MMFFEFIYFNWWLITKLCWFLPYITMHQLRVYIIPLGCPWALALSALLHAPNLHWSSISHMVVYMFQCYSLKSSLPCLKFHHYRHHFVTGDMD